MNATDLIKTELFRFLHDVFPGARSAPDASLRQQINRAWEKGRHYGFKGRDELGTFVIAAYVLGDNFDQDIPEVAALLQDASHSAAEKTDRLEALTEGPMQALIQAGAPGEPAGADEPDHEEAAGGGNPGGLTGSVLDYYDVQRASHPYRAAADWAVERLRQGDLQAVLARFSPGVFREVGRAQLETALRREVIPFFQAGMAVEEPVDLGTIRYENGSEGYYFSMHLTVMRRTKPYIRQQPFEIVVVRENGQFLIAGIDVE
jgi:hypothetical protein